MRQAKGACHPGSLEIAFRGEIEGATEKRFAEADRRKLKLSTVISMGNVELLELLLLLFCSGGSGLRSTLIDPADTRSAWKVPASSESGDQSTAISLMRA